MASMKKVKGRKKLYRVQYKCPHTNKWKQQYHDNKDDAVIALSHWQQVELFKKNNMDWESLLYKQQAPITVGEVFTAFTNNVLSTMTNVDTKAKYNVVMNSCRKVFPDATFVSDIRTMKKDVVGMEVTGWTIYKREMELVHGRSRRGIDSYLRDILHIFNWAFEEELIHKLVMKKSDRYKDTELKPIVYKTWSDEEIHALFNHPGLDDFQKDIMWLFAVLGSRANELTGYQRTKPYKELHWEHVNLENNTLQLLQKRRQIRETVDVHPSVMVILKKWKERGHKRPLDMKYKALNKIMHEIVAITGIEFTCHDLRRMKAQVLRNETHDLPQASRSIGDKSDAVVDNHYAGISIAEQRATNNQVHDSLTSIISKN
jgi:integrase